MNALHVLLVTPEYPDCGQSYGIGRYMAALRTGLERAGERVSLLVANQSGTRLIAEGGETRTLAAARGPRWLAPPQLGSTIGRIARELAVDLVETSNWHALTACADPGRPVVVRLSTPAAIEARLTRGSQRLALNGYATWERRAVRRATAVIADSLAMASQARRVYGRSVDRVIPHALDLETPTQIREQGQEVLYVGRCDTRKGIDVLLRAWPIVHAARPAAHLHLIGSDPSGRIKPIARRLPALTCHGKLDDPGLAALRSRCSLQVVPSRFESFGLVVLEAWAAGQAVVASRAGALEEVVGHAGWICRPGDHGDLAATLVEALEDPQERCRRANLGLGRLSEQFDHARWIGTNCTFYRRLISR